MLASLPEHVAHITTLRPYHVILHPFLGGEDEEAQYHSINGVFVPFDPSYYPSHARVIAVHELCREAHMGDLVMFPYMAYDWHEARMGEEVVKYATCHENNLYGKFEEYNANPA